jgi:uncharacterized protein (DUF1697 family)
MQKYIAFLRAINVGGHNVKMDHLRGLFEAIGHSHVESFIASGNVIFDSPSPSAGDLEIAIAAHLQAQLGYAVATFIRTPSELVEICAYWPFEDADHGAEGHTLHIGFLAQPPGSDAEGKLQAFATDSDAFHIAGREVYWLRRGRMSDSEFSGAVLEKTLGQAATFRNANTVRKIAAKYT